MSSYKLCAAMLKELEQIKDELKQMQVAELPSVRFAEDIESQQYSKGRLKGREDALSRIEMMICKYSGLLEDETDD